jgi:hypothetical protein
MSLISLIIHSTRWSVVATPAIYIGGKGDLVANSIILSHKHIKVCSHVPCVAGPLNMDLQHVQSQGTLVWLVLVEIWCWLKS